MALKTLMNVMKRPQTQSPTTRSTLRSSSDLFSRITQVGYPNRSIVPDLDKWVEQGKEVKDVQLRRIIRNLRSRRRPKVALEVSEWMSSNREGTLSSGDYAIRLDLISIVHGMDNAESYFNSLNDRIKTEKTYGALLNCFVREGLTDKSVSLLRKMKEIGCAKSPLNYNCLMRLYIKAGQPEKVPQVLSEMMEADVSPDTFSYKILLNSYGVRSDLGSMEKVLEEMESQHHVIMDWNAYAVVANYFMKARLKDKALLYLKKCEEKLHKGSLGYNHLISLYANLGDAKEVMRLWNLKKAKFKRQLNRDHMTIVGSLVKLSEIEEAERLFQEWEMSCEFYDFRMPNILLLAYCQKGLVEKAREMLDNIVKRGKTPTPNSWAIIAAGYVNAGDMEKAFECMKEALSLLSQNKGWRPKFQLVSSILNWLKLNKASEVEPFLCSLRTVPSLLEDGDLWETINADDTDDDIM